MRQNDVTRLTVKSVEDPFSDFFIRQMAEPRKNPLLQFPRILLDCLQHVAAVIESNHSRDMLKTVEQYPWELKQRILSRLGHLSNEEVAEWVLDGFDGQARHIVLAHLSQPANNQNGRASCR